MKRGLNSSAVCTLTHRHMLTWTQGVCFLTDLERTVALRLFSCSACMYCSLERQQRNGLLSLQFKPHCVYVFIFLMQDYHSWTWYVPFSAHSVSFIKLCVLVCLAAAKANAGCAHSQANSEVPRDPAFSPAPLCPSGLTGSGFRISLGQTLICQKLAHIQKEDWSRFIAVLMEGLNYATLAMQGYSGAGDLSVGLLLLL